MIAFDWPFFFHNSSPVSIFPFSLSSIIVRPLRCSDLMCLHKSTTNVVPGDGATMCSRVDQVHPPYMTYLHYKVAIKCRAIKQHLAIQVKCAKPDRQTLVTVLVDGWCRCDDVSILQHLTNQSCHSQYPELHIWCWWQGKALTTFTYGDWANLMEMFDGWSNALTTTTIDFVCNFWHSCNC